MFKRIFGVMSLFILLVGCSDSGPPAVTAGSLPSLSFTNGKSQIILYRNKSVPVTFSCHPEIVISKIEMNGEEVDSEWLLDADLDCSDSKGFLQMSQQTLDEVFSVNIFTKIGNKEGQVSQIFVKDPLEANSPKLETKSFSMDEDSQISSIIAYSSPDGSPVSMKIIQKPSHGMLTNFSDGAFTYVPDEHFHGADFFTIEAVNDKGLSQKTYSIDVASVNDIPVAQNQSLILREDEPKAFSLYGYDLEGGDLSYSVISGPAHGSLAGSGADWTYTPNLNFFGIDSFTYQVSDGDGVSEIKTISFTVSEINDSPVDVSTSTTLNEDEFKVINITSFDVEGEDLSYSLTASPDSGVLSGTLPEVVYTPNANFNGEDSFSVSITDGVNTTVSTISITVNEVNDAPTAGDLIVSLNEDEPKAISLVGLDIDGQSLTYTIVSGPANGALSGVGLNKIYTPSANFNGGDSFTYKVSDGTLESSIHTVSLTVNPVNDAPVAINKIVSLNEDTAKSFSLEGTDVEGAALSYVIVSNPSNGSITGAAPNLSYSPSANFNGNDSLTYRVQDGSETSGLGTITFNVNSINDVPEVQDLSFSIDEDETIDISLVGTDADGDSLNFKIIEGPQNGTLSGEAPDYTYVPEENFNGVDTFRYCADDGTVDGDEKTVTINIAPVNDSPIANDQSYEIDQDTSLSIIINGYDVDGDSLTVEFTQGPSSGALVGLTYTPDFGYTGTDIVEFRVFDGQEYSELKEVNILVKDSSVVSRACSIFDGGDVVGSGIETTVDGGNSWGACIATTCVDGYDILNGTCSTLTPEIYVGEGYFMDHNKLDGNSCSSDDCKYSGDKRRVETAETSCLGLEMTDSRENFIWTCEEESGLAVFYSRINLNKSGILESAIDIDNLEWKKTKLSLVGAVQSPTQSKEFDPWKDNIRSATNVLSQEKTVYVISEDFRGSIIVTADKISLVGNYHFNNRNEDYTSFCFYDRYCHIKADTQKYLFFEVQFIPELNGNNSGPSRTSGIYLSSISHSYVFNSSFSFLHQGVGSVWGSKNIFYRNKFFNNENSLTVYEDEDVFLRNTFTHSGKGLEIYGDDATVNANTFINNERGLFFRGDNGHVKNSIAIENDRGFILDQYHSGVVSNLVSINNDSKNLEVKDSSGTSFEYNFSFNKTNANRECSVNSSDNLASDCSSSWTVENPLIGISITSIFDTRSYALGVYSSLEPQRHELIIPNTVGAGQNGTYTTNENTLNFNVYNLELNSDYFTADFKISGRNISSDPSTPEVVASSDSINCEGELLRKDSTGSLVLAMEMPLSMGNSNGLCEAGEDCEYLDQYGGVMKSSLNKTTPLCKIDAEGIYVYPAQK